MKRFTKAEHALIQIGREACGDDYLEYSTGGDIEVLWKVDDEDIPRILREKRIDLSTMDDDRRVHLCMVWEELRERGSDRVDEWDLSYSYDEDLPPSLRGYSRLRKRPATVCVKPSMPIERFVITAWGLIGESPLVRPMMPQGNQPVFILQEGTEQRRGKTAQDNNISAAIAVGDAVKSTLGPKGMDKMLVDSGRRHHHQRCDDPARGRNRTPGGEDGR